MLGYVVCVLFHNMWARFQTIRKYVTYVTSSLNDCYIARIISMNMKENRMITITKEGYFIQTGYSAITPSHE